MQQTITEKQYRVLEETADEVLAIVERENLIAWSKMNVDPDHPDARFQPLDMTSSSSLKLTFRTPDGEGEITAAISTEAAKQEGGGDVISALADLLRGCVRDEALLSEKTEQRDATPFIMGFAKSDTAPASGTWTCPGCGRTGNFSDFCPDCGAPRTWTCPECGNRGNSGNYCPECGRKRPDKQD